MLNCLSPFSIARAPKHVFLCAIIRCSCLLNQIGGKKQVINRILFNSSFIFTYVVTFGHCLFLMRMKEESEKIGLTLNIKKTKIMASSPITSWQIVGETMEIVTDFIFLVSKITMNGDNSHEIKDICEASHSR